MNSFGNFCFARYGSVGKSTHDRDIILLEPLLLWAPDAIVLEILKQIPGICRTMSDFAR